MLISHKYKYVFIETPQTGCSAIRNELIENYSGEIILSKHSVYSHFLAIATSEEKKYFVFSSIRNPLDKSVSTFLKFKTNHRNRYTNKIDINDYRKSLLIYRDRLFFRKVVKPDFSFKNYLESIKPYDGISTLDHKKFNFIIRFENLNDDFKKVLKQLQIKSVRDLPLYNATATKKDYNNFYEDLEVQKLAFKKFAVFMNYWNYKFPSNFDDNKISYSQIIKWKIYHIIRIFIWSYYRKGLKDLKDV